MLEKTLKGSIHAKLFCMHVHVQVHACNSTCKCFVYMQLISCACNSACKARQCSHFKTRNLQSFKEQCKEFLKSSKFDVIIMQGIYMYIQPNSYTILLKRLKQTETFKNVETAYMMIIFHFIFVDRMV